MVRRRKSRRRSFTRNVRVARRRASRGLLGMNLKHMAIGGVALMGVKIARPHLINLGNYNAAAESVIAGAAMSILKMDNKDLISAGIKQGVAQLGADLLAGRMPSLNGGAKVNGEGV
jgi:hypothetical protein